jgi:SpoVK/Ycf46/Vps4 family AAA+-type ATPase
MYGQIHDNKNIKPIVPGSLSWELSLADSAEDSFLMMLPATIHGYDVRNHEWQELFVCNLALVMPNAEVFDQVALSKNDKDLLHAMIISSMSKLHTRPNPGSRPDKDGRQILLLHGAPGSGKTFTAEAIAAMTARPLFRISGNDIGTASLKATQYLQGVSKLCNAWNCVVLFDNADIFFEQMRTQELERNAMVLSFLRSLESFKTLVVLTTNRVGVFDETVRSRIHLVVCVQKWDALTRKKVWKKMLSTHSDDNYTAEGDQLLDQVKDFTELPLNGWEISNMVKMAAQLARAHDQKLRRDHFVVVSKNSKDFSDLKIDHMALELKKHERNHPHTARINSRGDQKIWPSGTPHNTSRSPTWPVKY